MEFVLTGFFILAIIGAGFWVYNNHKNDYNDIDWDV